MRITIEAEALSIVGFDDVEHVTPALTTVRQALAEMGRTAVSLLSRLLERQSFEAVHVGLATRSSFALDSPAQEWLKR